MDEIVVSDNGADGVAVVDVAVPYRDLVDVISERNVMKFVAGIMTVVVFGSGAVVITGSVELEVLIFAVSTKYSRFI